ncbi:MAG: hypothetical protein KF832_02850 [Caldilineaceae bacterium]|nr:hypothetical protein [Caldilineaceae bacterium]
MICHTFDIPHANIAASPLNDHTSIQGQLDSIPIDVILPLIEEEWKDEEYAYGEHYDKIYSKFSAHAANLRKQLSRHSDLCQYQQIEKELAEVEAELCAIALKFDESTEYPL